MNPQQWTYITFGAVLILAITFDLGLLSKKGTAISIKQALRQTLFWVVLALSFFGFMWFEYGHEHAFAYLSAYLMEWSLSIDNIFVFILIFNFFGVKEKFTGRVLLIGILMAIVFRIIFITVGVELVKHFEWLLYIFGAFLVYTGYHLFFVEQEEEFNPRDNKVYKFLQRIFPITHDDGDGKYTIIQNGKKYYTTIFVVVIILATTDIVFAVDSIPAVFGISKDRLVIYTSNIFAVLGLRSLYFMLRGAVSKFDFLQQGIAIVLVFIGFKMIAEGIPFFMELFGASKEKAGAYQLHVPTWLSLMVIVTCIGGSILYSLYHKKKHLPPDIKE
ncbi:MAG: TerC/Alx family metal homeostasis membrane protein [Sphingobacteriales bacterium]|nr:TerC/Alx family metal homeostasis membrane protein [Sphingobacteriales bacterium]